MPNICFSLDDCFLYVTSSLPQPSGAREQEVGERGECRKSGAHGAPAPGVTPGERKKKPITGG